MQYAVIAALALVGCAVPSVKEEADGLADCMQECAEDMVLCFQDVCPVVCAPEVLVDALTDCASELQGCNADCVDGVGE